MGAAGGAGAAGLIAFVYGAAFIGQGLSVEEMCALRSFVDRSVFQQLKRTALACGTGPQTADPES